MSRKDTATHVANLMERIRFPQKAVRTFTRIENRLQREERFGEALEEIVRFYMYPTANDMDAALKMIKKCALRHGVPVYTLNMVFQMHCSEILLERYHERGIDEDIYWATMADLRCKLLECYDCHGIPGSFSPHWFDGFFKLERFALGRFQYETTVYHGEERILRSGHILHDGDKMFGFHIPSSGISLTDEVRLDSYRKAYSFFKDEAEDGKLVFCCGSWLLFPYNNLILPPRLNTLRFMQDFEIIEYSVNTSFTNAWRVFGIYANLPSFLWPEDTAQRRAFKQWRMAGGVVGNAFGVFVFDGEKIL